MGADPQTHLASELARLRASIDRAAAATEASLAADPPPAPPDADRGNSRTPLAEHRELCRQRAALRERVTWAESRSEDPRALRAELATLLFFARTLQADAERWHAALEEQREDLERRTIAARRERQRSAAEHATLVGRRDALQSTIVQTAARIAQQYRGEWRRTIPVVTLGEGLTVCSASVSCPRRGLRLSQRWLVTLTRSHDVLVRRE